MNKKQYKVISIQMKIETQTITKTNRDTKIQIQWKHSINLGCPRCGEVVMVHTMLLNWWYNGDCIMMVDTIVQ